MLAYIKGTVEDICEDSVVVENHGMGYRIYTSGMEIGGVAPGQAVTFYLHMNIREDDVSLYGFRSKETLELFRLFIGISGIGPKAALAILSALSPSEIRLAILSGDAKALTRANGVGAKGAQRIIMELKDKMDLASISEGDSGVWETAGTPASEATAAASMALVSLGYSQSEALQAIRQVEQADSLTEEALLKEALKKMV